ncbi:MAG TPA: glycosyltransferase family 2 protein, partial [Bauldia sp.]|nr:glycosyltransferase family 2 protein [Bauldia sp.]
MAIHPVQQPAEFLARLFDLLPGRRDVSLITAIKDRSESLERAFATWVRLRDISEIVIVDWSSADSSTIERVARRDRRVRVARVEGEKYFNHTRTKNLGVHLSSGRLVMVTDADIMMHRRMRHLFAAVRSGGNRFFRGWIPGGYGTVIVRREMFDAVGGYDERMEGWGGSDDDLYHRLTLHGLQSVNIPEGLLAHIDHPEEARHVNMLVPGRKESQSRNAA